ncbi:MAG: hypothetical protein A4E70_00589 [Syntrophus sp. PtaU1.Bin005]|uniref:hypothetical protein n=1 Tax=Syntrophus TaxID=43773 RepID=UPI0009C4C460|nr:MAG: hypothetical protein A4E69_02318 [Syntrophus sp. PtaB.Bin138]OPY82806.1 MAG: hypothetical protein A4E70_00589 [Syntrophus sp. PtaU1.Bin005]
MDKFTQVPLNKIEFNQNNLYREDSFTDMQVGSIRVLIPVKPDGSEDSSRAALFIGQAQVMSPQGPLPLQGPIEAKSLSEAMDKFPQAMEQALKQMLSEVREYQRQQESGLILPGK